MCVAMRNGLFHYLIIYDNKWCPGGCREYVPGGGHLNACPRRGGGGGLEGIIEACPGEWNNIEDCPGGWGKTEARPGGIYKSVPGGVEV